ncbi:MAG TPA: hypothetical protein VF278_21375 [Pirellulales bacterium]
MRYLTARQVFDVLRNQTLWILTRHVHEVLAREGIEHAIVGGIAVCLYGYH